MNISASVTVAVASTPPPPPAQAPVVGVNATRDNYDLLQDLHPQSIRGTRNWDYVEKQRGVYDWIGSGVEAHMQFAKANNISVIGGLWYGNGKLYPSVNSTNDAQAEIGRQGMANYAKAMAQKYGPPNGPMQYVEVWNEWFGSLGPCVASCDDPVIYAKLLCDVHAAVKSVNPSVKVIGGAFAGSHYTTKFLGDVVNLGGNCMDLIAVHTYMQNAKNNRCSNGGNTDPVKGVACYLDEYITRYDNIVKNHNGGKSIPFAITENGWNDHDTPAGELDARTFMRELFNRAKSIPAIHGIWWYSFRPGGIPDQRGWSLVDGTRKKLTFFEMQALATAAAK